MRKVRWTSLIALFAALAAFGAVACSGPVGANVGEVDTSTGGAFGVVTPQEAAVIVRDRLDDPTFVILDIRTPQEIAQGHLPEAAFMDFYAPSFRDDLAQLDRSKTYLIYCRTGNRTGQAYAIMEELGFEKVYDMGGGITQWIALGYPICRSENDGPQLCYGVWPEPQNGS